ncbi:restriction endonuclease subunit S [Massilia glaciei]|uniref:Restriction endonuclease subunit S n=1 Tax=Massilia glaciei TaxID=1524097 RepID=A0A2U2HGK8_9BURK|nr:restriction endonuclease subunit S [Massilia glaciei]PWF44012.1 restriction endonuclease subunit S [Massilia glaciei]
MKFKPHPKYKASGVEWLGDVPADWKIKRLKLACDVQTGDKDTVDAVKDGAYPLFVRSQTIERINTFTFDCEAVLTAGDGVGVGKVFHYYNGPFDFHQRVYMLNNFRHVSGRFLYFFLKENFHRVALEGGAKSTVDSLRMPLFLNFPLTVPSPPEQLAICAFLDRETAKIDTLIAKQEAMIELLKEKRQAVISHAVTKGLDPNVPMKDSKVEWLGDVPEHWTTAPIKYAINSIEQGWSPQCNGYPAGPGEWGVLKVGCVNYGTFNPEQNKSLPAELNAISELAVARGDLLISRANTRELVGSAAVVHDDYPRLMLCDKLYRLRVDKNQCVAQFVALFLGTAIVRNQIELAAGGASASMLNIAQGTILNLQIPLPNVTEQLSILASIESTTRKLDTLISKAQQAISLQMEHRTALISAAVTGKIDVRNEVAERKAA